MRHWGYDSPTFARTERVGLQEGSVPPYGVNNMVSEEEDFEDDEEEDWEDEE